MTDGPYKTLPQGKEWKKLARVLTDGISDTEAKVRQACRALASELDPEVTKLVNMLLSGEGGNLFSSDPDDIASQMEAVRLKQVGSLSRAVQEVAADELTQGRSGYEVALVAFEEGIDDTLRRHGHGMIEHYIREGNMTEKNRMRAEIQTLLKDFPKHEIAAQLVRSQRIVIEQEPRKQRGTHEGPPIGVAHA